MLSSKRTWGSSIKKFLTELAQFLALTRHNEGLGGGTTVV